MSKIKLWLESLKKYWFKNVWKKEHFLNKLFMFLIAFSVVIPLSLIFFFIYNGKSGCLYGKNPFIYIDVTNNSGIAFGNFQNNFILIYFVQSLVSIVIFTITIFIHKKTYLLFLYIIFLGGFFNLLQRSCSGNNTVLDYFHFGFWESFAIFNVPDAMIIIGGFCLILNVLISTFFEKEKDQDQKQQQNFNKANRSETIQQNNKQM